MDGSPRQKFAKARKTIKKVDGMIFKTPARSTHLNQIENVFSIFASDLKKQAVDIISNSLNLSLNFQRESSKPCLHVQWRKLTKL